MGVCMGWWNRSGIVVGLQEQVVAIAAATRGCRRGTQNWAQTSTQFHKLDAQRLVLVGRFMQPSMDQRRLGLAESGRAMFL